MSEYSTVHPKIVKIMFICKDENSPDCLYHFFLIQGMKNYVICSTLCSACLPLQMHIFEEFSAKLSSSTPPPPPDPTLMLPPLPPNSSAAYNLIVTTASIGKILSSRVNSFLPCDAVDYINCSVAIAL